MFLRFSLLLSLVFFSIFFVKNSFAQDIFLFLEDFQKDSSQANISPNISLQKQNSFSALEKEVYYFFKAKFFFSKRKFSQAAELLKELSPKSSQILQKSLAQYLTQNIQSYSIAELVLLIELFDKILDDVDLLTSLKDKLPAEQNKKIYKKLWLLGELKSIQVQKKNNFLNTNEEYLQHLFHLYKKREYTYLLEQYPKVRTRFQKDSKNYNQYLYQYALLLRKKRKYQKALQVLKPAIPIRKVLLLRINLHLILEQEKSAHLLIEKAKKTANKKTINLLRLDFARHHYLNREYQDALFRFQKINWKYLSPRQKEEATWRQFYSGIHQNRYQKIYKKIPFKSFQNQRFEAAICYWYEKLQKANSPHSKDCFSNYFLSYYGWRAADKKEVDFQKLVPEYKKQNHFLPDRNVLLLQKIYQLGESLLGDFLVKKYISLPKHEENFQKAAYLFDSNQRYQQLIILGNDYYSFQDLKDSPFLTEWLKALFPLGYIQQITKLAQKHNLEPALVLALIREESHFDPEAISSAGALGLMQLMPFTAKDVARRKKISLQDQDLNSVSLNLELGVAYLSWELKRFRGETIYALAAYNGGGGNVRKWQKKNRKDLDYWVEAIPFLETKNYIKKVTRSYHIYNHLYQEKWEKIKQDP